jgi:hypothetical protein
VAVVEAVPLAAVIVQAVRNVVASVEAARVISHGIQIKDCAAHVRRPLGRVGRQVQSRARKFDVCGEFALGKAPLVESL